MANILTTVYSFDDKIRRAKDVSRQLKLARKMFQNTIKAWESGIKGASLNSPVTAGSEILGLWADVTGRMNQYAAYVTDINTIAQGLEFDLPVKVKPTEPYYFTHLDVDHDGPTITAVFGIDEGASGPAMEGPFYDLAAGDVIRIQNSADSGNDGYHTILTVTASGNIASMVLTLTANLTTTNATDTTMTITKVQDHT